MLKQNKFGHHNVGEQPSMIEKFQSPISMAIETFQSPQKGRRGGGVVTCFWKALNEGFPNRCDKLAFYGDQKNSVTIGTLN